VALPACLVFGYSRVCKTLVISTTTLGWLKCREDELDNTMLWRNYRLHAAISTIVLAAAYLGIIGYFMHEEQSLVFEPVKHLTATEPEFISDSEEIRFPSEDGIPLSARIVLSSSKSPQWVLFFHSNGGNVSTHQLWWHVLHSTGANVLALDYRGYGESGGTPSESGLYMDGAAAYQYLVNTLHVPPKNIILYGFSLGSAVAIDLASKGRCAGLIVEGAPLSIAAVGQEEYPFLPVALIVHNRFDSAEKISMVTCPILFLHGRGDLTVPLHQAQELYKLAHEPKQLLVVNGNRHSAVRDDESTVAAAVQRFLDEIAHTAAGKTDEAPSQQDLH
jgi:fermentation-respiration switch protein FrsA (DUF1100 family)